jgi:hypothetical protein
MSIDQLNKQAVWVVIRRCLVFSLIAAILLTALDYLHIFFEVRTVGTNPYLTPIKFAAVGLFLSLLSFIIDSQPHKSKLTSTIVYGLIFALGYASTAIFSGNWPTLILIIAWFLQAYLMVKFTSSIKELIETIPFALLLVVLGPLAEYLEVRQGLFSYRGSSSIPVWLPFLWANGAFFVRALVGSTRGKAHIIAWLLTAITPLVKVVVIAMYFISAIRERGWRSAWKTGLQLYGWKR